MAEKGAEGPAKPALTAAQLQLSRRRQELDYWKKNASRLRGRNLLTGLAIGAFVVGMCILRWGPEEDQYDDIIRDEYKVSKILTDSDFPVQ